MNYRGYKIDDRTKVWKSARLSKHCSDGLNTISLTSEDLKELLERVEKKEKELEGIGIPHDDICVTVVMTGDSKQYNPNGADWEASFETELSWSELESKEEAEKRIEKTKHRIDEGIEIERQKREAKEKREKKALEQALKLVKESGFKVSQ